MTAVRYLLVGNAPNPNLAAAKHANAIIQFNACPNAEALAAYHTPYVFVVNTGHATSGRVVEQLRPLRPLLPDATIVLARNPTYYTLKKWILRECGQEHWRAFQISSARACLRDLWRIETLSFLSSLRVDLLMMAKGMPFPYQPSTGLIAYHWLRQRLKPVENRKNAAQANLPTRIQRRSVLREAT